MSLKTSVWFLFFAVIFKGVPADVSLDDGTDELLDFALKRETNVKRMPSGAVKLLAPPVSSSETKNQPASNPWKRLPVNHPMRTNPSLSYVERTQDSLRSGIKTLPTGPEKSMLRTALHGVRDSTDKNEKPLRGHKPFISNDPSSSTTEKVSVEDRPTVKEEESLLISKVKASNVSQPSVGKIAPSGTSQEMGHMGSKGTLRGSASIPKPVTPGVSQNKTEMPEKEAEPAYDDDLVLLSLIDVPERDETTTCGPGERWHNNRCRTAIR